MYDWGVRDSERQKRDRDGERQREAKRGAPLVRKHAHRRARLSLRAGTRRHGHARTQMNLRAARHAGTHLRVSRHPNSQASGHVNMQACQRDGRRWSGGKQRETEGDRETGGGRERQREAERGREAERDKERQGGRASGEAPCVTRALRDMPVTRAAWQLNVAHPAWTEDGENVL
jgi:hypothetical protein